ncbi:MAG: hypothetical protein K940chlam7_00134 [Chlamydiae bacterium]|nr:hypothetical protein [Chlamydiota bacterium]
MATPARLVQQTTQGISPNRVFLPTSMIPGLRVVNKVHHLWSWYRRGTVYTNPDNLLKLAAGHGMNFFRGDSLALRISATCVLIATRILDCVEQQAKVVRSWRKLVDACKGNYCTPIKCSWEVKAKVSLFSASTIHWFKHHGKSLLLKIQWVAYSIFHLIKQAFLISMRIMDVIDTFSLNDSTANEAINEFFVNGEKCVRNFVENKQQLIDGLKSNKDLIDKILKGIGLPIDPDRLIETATTTLDKTAQVLETADNVNKTTGAFLVAWAKKLGYEISIDLGLEKLAPKALIPSATPPWEIPDHIKITDRFPPPEWTTKPSIPSSSDEPGKVLLLEESKEQKSEPVEPVVLLLTSRDMDTPVTKNLRDRVTPLAFDQSQKLQPCPVESAESLDYYVF